MTLFPGTFPSPTRDEQNETCAKCKARNDNQWNEKQFLNSTDTSKEQKGIMSKNAVSCLCTVAVLALCLILMLRFLCPSTIYGIKDLECKRCSANSKNRSPTPGYPDEDTKSETFDPQYIINRDNVCAMDATDGIELLVLVSSSNGNFNRRQTIRDTWGILTKNGGPYILGFFMGSTVNSTESLLLKEESETYRDMILGDFEDTNQNLTLRAISMLKWAAEFCPQAKFFLKADDDIYTNFEILSNIFCNRTYLSDADFITGFMKVMSSPGRNANEKYLVSDGDVPDVSYSQYISVSPYLTTGQVTKKPDKTSLGEKFLNSKEISASGPNEQEIDDLPSRAGQFHSDKPHSAWSKFKDITTGLDLESDAIHNVDQDMINILLKLDGDKNEIEH